MKEPRYSQAGPRRIGVLALLLFLAGCTASWKAPMETRGSTPPRQTATPAPRRPVRGGYYRVRRGDTLFSIAWRTGLDYRSLARWNGIRPPYVIYPGQLLRLRPLTVASRPTAPRQTQPKTSVAPRSAPRPAAQRPRPKASRPATRSRGTHRPPRERPAAASGRLRWRWPVQGPVLARWKAGDPLRKGIKIGGRAGAPVRAAEAGKVVYSGSGLIGYGRLIIIKHNDNYLSAYGHNRKLLVEQGQLVTRGQKIAEMGRANDGRAMLHFEIRRNGKPVDPLRLLPRR